MDMDEQALFQETPEAAAKRIIREAAPFAAQAISDLATDISVSPSVRLRAAEYIVDRNLGPVNAGAGKDDALEMFLEELNREANKAVPTKFIRGSIERPGNIERPGKDYDQ